MLPQPRFLPLTAKVVYGLANLSPVSIAQNCYVTEMASQQPRMGEFKTALNRITVSKDNTVIIPVQEETIDIEIKIRGFHGESVFRVQDGKAQGRCFSWSASRVPSQQIKEKGRKILKDRMMKIKRLSEKPQWKAEEENRPVPAAPKSRGSRRNLIHDFNEDDSPDKPASHKTPLNEGQLSVALRNAMNIRKQREVAVAAAPIKRRARRRLRGKRSSRSTTPHPPEAEAANPSSDQENTPPELKSTPEIEMNQEMVSPENTKDPLLSQTAVQSPGIDLTQEAPELTMTNAEEPIAEWLDAHAFPSVDLAEQ